MTLFLLNALFAFGWAAMIGSFTLPSLVIGFVLGFAALYLTRGLYSPTRYFDRSRRIVLLVLYFLYELVVSSIRVAHDVLTPKMHTRPGIIAVPIDAESDAEIMLLANLISLTPGTLSLDVSPDRKILYVHAMFIDDLDTAKQEIKTGMERRLLEAIR